MREKEHIGEGAVGVGRDGDFWFESGGKCICAISKWVSDRQVGKSLTYRREIKLRAYFPSQNF